MMRHNRPMTAMILAAGLGTRLRPYTAHIPKAMFTINGKPLLALAIESLLTAGFKKILVNTHHLHTQIEAFLDQSRYDADILYRYEPQILGTGGGIRNFSDQWAPGPLLVMNADIVSTIDVGGIYRGHAAHTHPVTMAMHDCPQFNTVSVANGAVETFSAPNDSNQKLAFTGIHVVDGRILEFLPRSGPAHIIDAYEQMIASGYTIRAHEVRGHYWQDIGTPARYREAALTAMTPLAFETAFGTKPANAVHMDALAGDGSDRRWYRLSDGHHTLILADHHIRSGSQRQEVDAYIDIGRHLSREGAAVPRIYHYDRVVGLVFVEDLGGRHLQDMVTHMDQPSVLALYKRVIDKWLAMAIEAGVNFNPDWTYQTRHYDQGVIIDRECHYFMDAFVRNHLGIDIPNAALAEAFQWLADAILSIAQTGFMHRDLQSRNILLHGDTIGFIDFQGGRVGPPQYDLASLLIDPYVALPQNVQESLLHYCADALVQYKINPEEFRRGYAYCALARNLQILGAFAYLGNTKGKPRFLDYIPIAVAQLVRTLSGLECNAISELVKLARTIEKSVAPPGNQAS